MENTGNVTLTGVEPTGARQLAFGYTQEDLRVLIAPMAATGAEPIGSMGNDNALPVLSDKAPPLYSYFKQLFAQVTNPPIDPIRERVVMSLESAVGPQANLFESSPKHAHQLIIGQPLLRNFEIEKLKQVDHHVFSADVLDATWPNNQNYIESLAAGTPVVADGMLVAVDGTTGDVTVLEGAEAT